MKKLNYYQAHKNKNPKRIIRKSKPSIFILKNVLACFSAAAQIQKIMASIAENKQVLIAEEIINKSITIHNIAKEMQLEYFKKHNHYRRFNQKYFSE